MNKQLLAFFLAAFTVSLPLMLLTFFSIPSHKSQVDITIRSSGDVGDIVSSIESLHRAHVSIHTDKDKQTLSLGATVRTAVFLLLGVMLITASVGVVYKFYCKKFGIEATL